MSGARSSLGVAIVGAGMTPFGERFDQSYEDLLVGAFRACVESVDRGFDPDDIGAAWLATTFGSFIRREAVTGASLSDPLRLFPKPVTRVENACASGSDAIRNAAFAIMAGIYDVVLVAGVEKMRDIPTRASLIGQRGSVSHLWWHARGTSTPMLFAQYATVQMEKYGLSRSALTDVVVKNRANGILNPNAYHTDTVGPDDVSASALVCSPLHLLDCCPTTDGAAALLIASTDAARALSDDVIEITGLGLASDVAYSHWKPTFDGLPVTAEAARSAYAMAGIEPVDVDVAELHDCFSVAELLAYEDLGFCERGKSSAFVASGATQRTGSIPCNPSGGLIAKGHPIGATGVAQMAEVYWQLRGEAGRRQVGEPQIGLTHNVGGNGQVCCVNIARRAK